MTLTPWRLPVVVAVALLSLPSTSSAREYASKGTVEVSGSGSVGYYSTTYPYGTFGDISTSTLRVQLAPSVRYFPAKGFALIGGAVFGLERPDSSELADGLQLGLQGGLGYFFPLGTIFAGPSATLAYVYSTQSLHGFEAFYGGVAVQGQFELKVPVGSGGLFTFGPTLHYQSGSWDFEGGFTPGNELRIAPRSMSAVQVSMGVGYSLYF